MRQLRRSFALKLIAGGCLLALVVVSGVSGYLIFSRAAQTRAAAQSNADNRVGVMGQVLGRFTEAESLNAASSVANQQPLQTALSSADPVSAVSTLFAGATSADLSGQVLLISDASGHLLYQHTSTSMASRAAISTTPEAVRTALTGGQCTRSDGGPTPGGCGVELLDGNDPAYVVALPVVGGGQVLGSVAYAAPLTYQLERFQALFGFPTAFVPARHTDREVRPAGDASSTDATLRSALSQSAPTSDAIYNAPLATGGVGAVAGSFVPVRGAAGEVSGYIGVEVPLSQFVGDEHTDIVVLALISIFLLLLVAGTVILFVARFVKRPVARLERGVARIAGGDYTTDIQVRSEDELGRLAANVNRMRSSIAGYVRQIEEARARLDSALERVSGVSRALTTTTTGVGALQQAVVRTAAAIGGDPASSVLALREEDSLVAAATAGSPPALAEWSGLEAVLSGETVRLEHPGHGVMAAVPMFYQDNVVGALAVITPAQVEGPRRDIDVGVLAVLANNAAIAMENTRLFEQERQTVQRLLELDSLKTDFLSTVQHELRTPLTAILGLAELLDMCWGMWEEEPKLEAVRDIQVAARNLYDIVETIIDYSAMEDAQVGLNPTAVPLRMTFDTVLELVGERYKGGLPVPADILSDEDISVYADPARLTQVLRAVVDNAMKFSDGRGRVRVSFAAVDRGRRVRIEIADQGIGIPADEMPRIFDRFYQVDNTATRKHGGTGMGLALVKRMVQAHGASVEIISRVGEGTRVVLIWPTSPQSASTVATPQPEERDDKPRSRSSGRRAVPVQ